MITPEVWGEIVDWLAARFGRTAWNADQAVAAYRDVHEHDPTDVWAAVHSLYGRGLEYPPSPSQLLAATVEEARRSAREDQYRALPEQVDEPTTWEQYTKRRFGEVLTAQQVIERLHAEKERA